MRICLIIRLGWVGKGKGNIFMGLARIGLAGAGASRVRAYACCMCEDTIRFSGRDRVCWVGTAMEIFASFGGAETKGRTERGYFMK